MAVRWWLSIVMVAAATLMTLWLRDVFQPNPTGPYHIALFFCAILFSSRLGGLGPGIFAALLSILPIKYYFSPPFHTFTTTSGDLPRLVVLLITGLLISWLTGRQKQVEVELRRAHDELEEKVRLRTQELQEKTREVEEANRTLQKDIDGRKLMSANLERLNRLYVFSNNLNEVIMRFQDPMELYEKACQIAVDQCGFVMACAALVDPAGDTFKPFVHAGRVEGYIDSVEFSIKPHATGMGTAGHAYFENRVVCCNDIATDPNLLPWRDMALKWGYQSCAAVPLRRNGLPAGVLLVFAGQPGFFGAEEMRLLATMADNLSFAIESQQSEQHRVRAEAAVRDSNQQLQLLAARLQSLQEEERTRIAREIHDELGQLLTGLKMEYRGMEQDLEKLDNPRLNPILDRAVAASEITDALARSVQRIATQLRPGILDRLGLVQALVHEAERFQQRTGIACRFQPPEPEPQLPPKLATAVFRICQEALTNVARHANASEVEITFQSRPGLLTMEIRDDGKGLQASDLAYNKALGLLGMQERARQLGGEISFQPGHTRGTVVALRIPTPQPQDALCSK